MFSNLLFLALAILLTSLSAEVAPLYFSETPIWGFFSGLLVYGVTVALVAWQTVLVQKRRPYRTPRLLFLANIELLTGLLLFGFVCGGQKVIGLLSLYSLDQTAHVVLSLSLYFGGLAVFHWTSYLPDLASDGEGHILSRMKYVEQQFRFLVPFALPFLFFTFVSDVLLSIPENPLSNALHTSPRGLLSWIGTLGGSLFFLAVVMIFLPYWVATIWQCRPIPNGALKDQLETLCKRAHFRNAGIMTWPVMTQAATAAIIGVVPRYRYVMFSKRLLRRLSPDSIEAVLAHEMGHSKHKHLLLYPFIIFGAMVLIGYYSYLIGPAINHYISLHRLQNDSTLWRLLQPLATFLPYVIILSLYFRFVFGYFSRLFERQADLHVFRVGLSPERMHQALNEVAILAGNIHDHPSWHHFSIRQRMNFLEQAARNPKEISKHDRRVRINLAIYWALLILSLTLLMGASAGAQDFLKTPVGWLREVQYSIDHRLNDGIREQILEQRLSEAPIHGNSRLVRRALQQSLKIPSSSVIPGVAEFYAAELLLQSGHYNTSAELMELAWQRFDYQKADIQAQQEFIKLSQSILWALEISRSPYLEAERLRATMNDKRQAARDQK